MRELEESLRIRKLQPSEYVESFDDSFLFSPEPTIMGDGFNIDNVTGYYSDPVKFNVSSINNLQTMKFTVQGSGITYEIMHDGSVLPEAAANGITYTPTDAMNGVLTLTSTFCEKLDAGINALDFEITDSGSNTGKATAQIALTKPVSITAQDLWFGTANMSAVVTNPATTEVSVKYRISGNGEWTTLPAIKGADAKRHLPAHKFPMQDSKSGTSPVIHGIHMQREAQSSGQRATRVPHRSEPHTTSPHVRRIPARDQPANTVPNCKLQTC